MTHFLQKNKFFSLIGNILYFQNINCEQKVFKTFLNSIENNFPSPPKLIFYDIKKSVEAVSNGNIKPERKVLKIISNYYNSP